MHVIGAAHAALVAALVPAGACSAPPSAREPKEAASPRASERPPSAVAPRPSTLPTPRARAATPAVKSFSVQALSRGKGVPDAAREALKRVRELVEADRERGVAVKLEARRLGLEGETRLCIEYQDARAAERARRKALAIVEGVDLVNLVEGPCVAARDKTAPPGKEDP